MAEHDHLILLLAAQQAQEDTIAELRAEVYDFLMEAEWRRLQRSQHYLTSDCLDAPAESAWARLWASGSDMNFLNVTSLTRATFDQLLHRFAQFYTIPRPRRTGGRPRKLRFHHQALGLLLHFYVGSLELNSLCMVFGVPPSTLSRELRRAEFALSLALKNYAPSRISWPSPEEQIRLSALVARREPLLQYTFGFIDGKNLRVQQPSNADLQNAMYNGWLHAVLVTGTICFAADGCIIWSRHNCPGSWNDADTSAGFRNKLLDTALCPDQRYGVVSDSAFPCSGDMVGRILTPMKDGDLERIRPARRHHARTLHNAITSVRQAAEWGMGSVEKVYHRLRLPLPYDVELRAVRLNNLFRLANYRVRISQIRTTFAGDMEIPR